MSKRTIEVIIAPDGTLVSEAAGFQGGDCEKATVFLEKALGVTGRREHKPEYYSKARRQQRIGQ